MNDYFKPVENSLFAAVFSPVDSPTRNGFRVPLPTKDTMNNLSHISMLYIYTNPPPSGTGVPSPKIADTVLRAESYNLNPPNLKTRKIGRYNISRNRWMGKSEEGEDRSFPLKEVHGNFHSRRAYKMMREFIVQNKEDIHTVVDSCMEKYLNMNPDILTKGRQTWCPFSRSSLPSATAYKNMMDFFQANLEAQPRTVIEVIQFIHKLHSLESINGYEHKKVLVSATGRSGPRNRKMPCMKRVMRRTPKTYVGEEKEDYLIEITTSFCGYLKLGERGKDKKRAIASPNMFLRVYLEIIESVHLELSKRIESSTIAIGGDVKKARILSVLESMRSTSTAQRSAQATQDATKWNECLSPELFTLFALAMYGDGTGFRPNSLQKLFHEICTEGHMLLALKRINLGEMPQCSNSEHYNRPPLTEENIPRFNERTQPWAKKVLDRMSNGYLLAPNGMLMGMHNALSTTVALSATAFKGIVDTRVTLRSSDDSITTFVASSTEALTQSIREDIISHKLIAVNYSATKTLMFKEAFGEYTSWFFDGTFVAQYGTDTSQLRPGGKNPYDDCGALMSQTAVSQTRLECNPFGAVARIQLGVSNIRRLYRIPIRKEPRSDDISLKVTLIADGGENPFTASNCHLDEISWKRTKVLTPEEQLYLDKICTIDNPFCSTVEEDVTWSKDTGELTHTSIETIRNLFTFQRRRNRTLATDKGKQQAEVERANSEALKIIQLSDPQTYISVPNTGERCSVKLAAEIRVARDKLSGLTEEESELISKALSRLTSSSLDRAMADSDGGDSDDDLALFD